jgi:hypothetical protein
MRAAMTTSPVSQFRVEARIRCLLQFSERVSSGSTCHFDLVKVKLLTKMTVDGERAWHLQSLSTSSSLSSKDRERVRVIKEG